MFALIGWIGRVLLILFIIRLVVSMFSGGARRAGPQPQNGARGPRGQRGPSEKTVDKLVRDPQCGTYVAEHTSIAIQRGGETLHFCSERCRDEYLRAA